MSLPQITPELRSEVKELFGDIDRLRVLIRPDYTEVSYIDYKLVVSKPLKTATIYAYNKNKYAWEKHFLFVTPRKLMQSIDLSGITGRIFGYLFDKYPQAFMADQQGALKLCKTLSNTIFGINEKDFKKVIAKAFYEALDPEIYKLAIRIDSSNADLSTYNWVWQNKDFIDKYIDTEPGFISFAFSYTSYLASGPDRQVIFNPDRPDLVKDFIVSRNCYVFNVITSTMIRDSFISSYGVENKKELSRISLNRLFKCSFKESQVIFKSGLSTILLGLFLDKYKIDKPNFTLLRQVCYSSQLDHFMTNTNKAAQQNYLRTLELGFQQIAKSRQKKVFADNFRSISQWLRNEERELSPLDSWQDVLTAYEDAKRLKELEDQFTKAVLVTGDDYDNGDFCW